MSNKLQNIFLLNATQFYINFNSCSSNVGYRYVSKKLNVMPSKSIHRNQKKKCIELTHTLTSQQSYIFHVLENSDSFFTIQTWLK